MPVSPRPEEKAALIFRMMKSVYLKYPSRARFTAIPKNRESFLFDIPELSFDRVDPTVKLNRMENNMRGR